MGLVVLDGLVVLLLVIAGLREAVMHAIPHDLRRAIAAGIGLFIAFIGAVNAKLVIVPTGTVLRWRRIPPRRCRRSRTACSDRWSPRSRCSA